MQIIIELRVIGKLSDVNIILPSPEKLRVSSLHFLKRESKGFFRIYPNKFTNFTGCLNRVSNKIFVTK